MTKLLRPYNGLLQGAPIQEELEDIFKRNHFVRASEQPIETMIFEAEGLWVKQFEIRGAHKYVPQHAHQLSHLTLLVRGTLNVWIDGQWDAQYDAPTGIYIKAGAKHLFETLTDDVILYCVHSLATAEALKVLAEYEIIGTEPNHNVP
jgi:quercetin dioxygenase-like cupin family protein